MIYFCSVEFEYILGKAGAINTPIKKDPRPKVKDALMSQLGKKDDSDSDDY